MASADLRDELECSICLDVYTDPVTLRCGHNFCRVCIDRVLDRQEGSGVYTCPDCREEFNHRPTLRKNTTLCNIAEHFLFTPPEQEETGIFCTYCDSSVPAVKTCLQCETSMCDRHLRNHNRSVEHTLISPTSSLKSRRCAAHQKILEYHCSEDSVCVCARCISAGHSGHQVKSLDEASEKKKEKLRSVLEILTSRREDSERRVQSLLELRRDVQVKAADISERVTELFAKIRRQLEDLEKRVLSEISRQEEQVSLSVSDLIRQLEIKKDELSRKMSHIEELCNMTDPLTVLLDQESDTGDFCDTEEGDNKDSERHDKKRHDVGDLDEGLISKTIHTGLSGILTGVKRGINIQDPADILLDVNTAANNVHISGDSKTATWSKINQNRSETPERFQYPQVLSTTRFSSGRHYWEVETSESGMWRVGMCYPSMEKKGDLSYIGENNKSWCLRWYNNHHSVIHDKIEIELSQKSSCHRFRVYLDYETGRLSFYELCDPIRHLHTFTTTFTEPLHVGFRLHKSWVRLTGCK